jgi:D-sedoheptulose 7-phosphate isomerase
MVAGFQKGYKQFMSKNLIKNYFNESSSVIANLCEFDEKIISFAESIYSRKGKNKILVVGNGGSSADADHFAGELICTYKSRSRDAHSAISLSSSSPGLTAWGNDFGFETFFERQIKAHGRKGDLLVCISTGGGDVESKASMNIVYAAIEAKKLGIEIISLIGKGGGELKKLSDLSFHIPSSKTSFIQEAHMSILHCVCEILDKMEE